MIDSSIALGIKPMQIEDSSNALAKVLQLQGAQQTNALTSMKMDEMQRGITEQNAIARLMSDPANYKDGALDYTGLTPKLYAAAPTKAGALVKSFTDQRTAEATLQKTGGEVLKQRVGLYRDNVGNVNDPQTAAQFIQTMYSDPALKGTPLTAEPLDHALSSIPTTPAELDGWKQRFALGATEFTKMNKPTITVQNLHDKSNIVATPGLGGVPTVLSSSPVGLSPDAVLQANTSTANNKRTIAAENVRAGINADGTSADGSGGLLSPESVANAAARYNMDGTLPPNLGRGTQGPRQTAQILNEAARQAAQRGDTPEAQRIAQLANKSGAAALTKLSTQEAMVGAFEKNFTKNADIAQELSAKVDRTGIPVLNKWVNAGKRSVTGDPDISAFDASVKATVNEYGKIVGGGTGSSATAQGEIAKIEGLLNAAQTKDQVVSVLNLMRRETANRMAAYQDQKAEIKAGMTNKPGAAPAGGTAPISPAGVPSDIAAILAKHGGK